MARKNLTATLYPSGMARRLMKHQGDVSSGSKPRLLASRTILGYIVHFYTNGEHRVLKTDLTDEEQFNSEILRFAHASILVNEPVGDKRRIWVDATINPVNVWLYGMPARRFVKAAKAGIQSGQLSTEFFVEQHPDISKERICNERNVRLSGRPIDCSPVSYCYIYETDNYSNRITYHERS